MTETSLFWRHFSAAVVAFILCECSFILTGHTLYVRNSGNPGETFEAIQMLAIIGVPPAFVILYSLWLLILFWARKSIRESSLPYWIGGIPMGVLFSVIGRY